MNNRLQQRIKIVQQNLPNKSGLVLARPSDIRYLTGFKIITDSEREAYLVITNSEITLLYPSFSPLHKFPFINYHAGHWMSDLRLVVESYSSNKKNPVSNWQADLSNLFADEYELLRSIPRTKWQRFDKTKMQQLRMIKEIQELELISEANEITEQVVATIKSQLAPGMTEIEVANQFQYMAKKLGATNMAFPPVIAFDDHSALPHHQPTSRSLDNEQTVLIDVGAKVDGYCADLTRTFWFGKQPNEQFIEIKKIVDDAYQKAIEQVKPGNYANQIDQTAREYIAKKGYGEQFIHSTGHGLGLEIHEPPSIYKTSDTMLEENMTITVEPGIYLEGKFGYRYENTIIVS